MPRLPPPEPKPSTSSDYESAGPCHESDGPSDPDSDEAAPNSPVPKPKGFRSGRDAKESDVFIAVMGVTGSGKSSFISACSGRPVKIGHELESCTSTVDVYPCNFLPGRTVYLIDTPGFDDTEKTDTDVLREIAAWLADSYKNKILLHGIIYLHRITDVRMQGSAKSNLTLFQKLCGDDAFERVILATTMWDAVDMDVAFRREEELMEKDDFWGWMVKKGSAVHRHRYEKGQEATSAERIVSQLVKHTTPVAISLQKQLVDDRMTLDQTSAGQELQSELLKERKMWDKKLKQVEENMKTAMDAETKRIMNEERDKYTKMIEKANQKTADLSITFENLIAQRDERISRMEGELRRHRTEIQQQREREQDRAARDTNSFKRAAGGRGSNAKPKHNETFPPVSVSMVGSTYSLTSLKCSRRKMAALPQTPSHGVKISAIIIGDKGSFVARHSNGNWVRSKYFERYYPHLDGKFKLVGDGKLATCALGADEQYYARWLDDTWSCYAHDDTVTAIEAVAKRCKRKEGYKIKSVALGYGNTYLISYGSAKKWRHKAELKTYYPQLRQVLDEQKPLNVLAVTLNPRNKGEYVLAYSHADGRYGISWYCLDPEVDKGIREWSEKTLGKEMSS
ncbi:hypothetical protein FALBO_11137 [Fusarium albosuccineum]|uniref:G domain-containing protein n=1 Tax=Fusarium albosuccineum TaxID=1237068 RepID=A0A8H4PAC5_9HYPO|nr:hypothetical protein FALBO_11137 [Fusarium albosuccineum]